MEEYFYTPVREELYEIRLLRLQPPSAAEKQNEPVRCHMDTFLITEAPGYHALSYVWGPKEDMKPLIVDGRLLNITPNLDTALKHLRQMECLQQGRIWIDAVCINQSDDSEKSWQVQMMKFIFSNATCTFSWLGPASDTISFAINTIAETHAELRDGHRNALDRLLSRYRDQKFQKSKGYEAVYKFFQHPYFYRLWILQEMLVSKKVQLVCGSLQIPLEAVCDVLHAYVERSQEHEAKLKAGVEAWAELVTWKVKGGTTFPLPVPMIFTLKRARQRRLPIFHFERLLWLSKGMMVCSEPLDSVYCLLGLIEQTPTIDLVPNYRITPQNCFTLVTKALLLTEGLGVLSMCHQPRQLSSLPSWVPDFSSLWTPDNTFLTPRLLSGYSKGGRSVGRVYNASRSSLARLEFQFTSTRTSLIAKGVKYGSIAQSVALSDFYDVRNHAETTSTRVLTELLEYIRAVLHIWPCKLDPHHHDSMLQSIASLARRDTEPGKKTTGLNGRNMAADVVLLKLCLASVLNDLKGESSGNGEMTANMTGKFMHAFELSDGLRGCEHFTITANGLLGASHLPLQPGDTVAVLYGGRMPYILRERDDGSYQFICETLFHGLMYGEALEGDYEEIDFNIY